MSVKIIVDSTSDLIESVKEQVEVVPLTVRFGEEEFIDGVTIDHKMFYEKLIESDVIPTTSQATPSSFVPYFDKVNQSGDSAVVITLSSKLSGTYQSAVIAAEDYDNIFVVDSASVAIGSGILVELAVKMANDGFTAEEIVEKLKKEKNNVIIVAMLDTLEYLKKGGRISAAVAFAGGVLNIKPVVCVDKGEIKMLGKARGSKQGNNLLVQEIEKAGGVDFGKPVLLGYTGLSDALLKKYVEDSKELWSHAKAELNCAVIGSTIGTHVGPGAVAVAFFKKN
ncbi:MAG: DegV family protein [Ruminococcus sp.]|nr:DegV family protein [Ruminococcus sp.]